MQRGAVEEQPIWEGTPSQWLNLKTFALSGVGVLLVLVAFAVLWVPATLQWRGTELYVLGGAIVLLIVALLPAIHRYLVIRCTRYAVTTERVRITTGVLSRRTDDTELYRVDDTLLVQPFLLRLVSRANVELVTSDRTTPTVILQAVPEASKLRDQIRRHVEVCRDRKKTRVLDFE